MSSSSCPECGAARFGMPWCGQCGHIEAAPVGYRHDAEGKPVWDGIDVIPVRDLRRPTRWRSTATTFSVPVKLVITYFFVLSPVYRTTHNVLDGNEDYTPIFVFGKLLYWGLVIPLTVRLWRQGFLPPRKLPPRNLPPQPESSQPDPARGGMLTGCPSTSDPAGGSRTTS